jgi:hypothetical protein
MIGNQPATLYRGEDRAGLQPETGCHPIRRITSCPTGITSSRRDGLQDAEEVDEILFLFLRQPKF